MKYIKALIKYTIILAGLILWAGCGKETTIPTMTPSSSPTAAVNSNTPTLSPTPTYFVAPTFTPIPTEIPKKVICIDPGHQLKGDSDKEPVGPGSNTMKDKVSWGTKGVVTGVHEYELTLTVSLMLQKELEARGYAVVLTRTEHDVNISNMERAIFAAEQNAEIFIRIHANAVSKDSVYGVETLCQTKNNPYNAYLYDDSRLLSQCLLDSIIAETEAKKRGVYEKDNMAGINWSTVPVSIIEMGYMTNKDEDVLLNTPEYQEKMVKGIADGVDLYFLEKENR